MSSSHRENGPFVRRIKLALIPVLGIVLAAVVFRADSHEVTEDPATCIKPRTRSAKAGSEAATGEATAVWPKAKVEDVIAFNPFEIPEAPPSPAPPSGAPNSVAIPGQKSSDSKTATPKRTKVGKLQAVYHDGRGAVAIVDSHIVRIGDLVNGCRVVEITRDGIVVEETSTLEP